MGANDGEPVLGALMPRGMDSGRVKKRWLGGPAFLSGSDNNGALDLHDTRFGYHNPSMVRWVETKYVVRLPCGAGYHVGIGKLSTLYVDADACPVKSEAERVATRLGMPMVLVCNGGLRPSDNPLVSLKIVGEGPDAADQWIADTCGPGDVVVTADIPLADRCLKAGSHVLQHDGQILTLENIGERLATRDLMKDIRAANPFQAGGGADFSKADRSRFLQSLDKLARLAIRGQ